MSDTHKLIGIKWPSYFDRTLNRNVDPLVQTVNDKSQIPANIVQLLYNYQCNQVLIKWNSKLYIMEKDDDTKKSYIKTEIDWHPLCELTE